MKKWDSILQAVHKWRHALWLCALLGCFALVTGWLFLDAVRPASKAIAIERQNDTYTVVTEPITPDGALRQPFVTDAPIYGGSFIFTIYDAVCFGNVTLSLENEAGEVLAQTSMDTTRLLDNTYQDLVFDYGIVPQGKTNYTYVLTFAPADAQSKLGAWASEEAVDGWAPYTLNGAEHAGTLGFSQVTNLAGGFLQVHFVLLAVFACLILSAGYCCVFIKRLPLPALFAIFAMTLGVLYLFVLPPYVAPDEEVHIHTAYAYSNVLFGIENGDGVTMRAADDIAFDKANTVDVFSYQTVAQTLFAPCEDKTLVQTEHPTVLSVSFVQYLPTIAGITLGRICGVNYTTLIFFGRICNLLIYVVLMSIAIWKMPAYKRIVCVVGLLPMSLQLAASFSYDTLIIALACVYMALVLESALFADAVRWKRIAVLAVLGLLLAPMKYIYSVLCLLCLLIPLRKCPAVVQKWMPKLLCVGAGLAVCAVPVIFVLSGVTPAGLRAAAALEIAHVNPDSMVYVVTDTWTPAYILTHLSAFIKLIARTIEQNTALYFMQLVGGKAGEPILRDIAVWSPAVVALLCIVGLSAVPAEGETPLLRSGQRAWSALLCVGTTVLLLFVCLQWTSIRDTSLWGLQGRYFLPLLPLILLVLQGDNLRFAHSRERALIFAEVVCNLIAVASIFRVITG